MHNTLQTSLEKCIRVCIGSLKVDLGLTPPPHFFLWPLLPEGGICTCIYSPIQWIQHSTEVLLCLATALSCAAMFSLMSSRGLPALPVSAVGPLDDTPIDPSPPPFCEWRAIPPGIHDVHIPEGTVGSVRIICLTCMERSGPDILAKKKGKQKKSTNSDPSTGWEEGWNGRNLWKRVNVRVKPEKLSCYTVAMYTHQYLLALLLGM